MVKAELRKRYLEERMKLSDSQWQEESKQILDNFSTLTLPRIQVLLSYHPITSRREFNVALCEQHLVNINPAITVAWPRLEAFSEAMEAVIADEQTLWVRNQYGILEPDNGESINPQRVDAVFVPLLAFDKKGFRVGYGKGYYDRYLARCAPDVMKIGFAYFAPVDLIDDINEFDVPLNYCITPTRVYEF